MTKVTVLLVRHGESLEEALKIEQARAMADYEQALEEYEAKQAESDKENDDSDEDDDNDEDEDDGPPEAPTVKRLGASQRLDPALTEKGFSQAGATMKHLLQAFSQQHRKMAFFSAPLKSCTSTAIMMSVAGVSHAVAEDATISWGLTTVETNLPPAAIPVVVQNGLCNGTKQVHKMGGDQSVINGGLLHCAAETWNDARSKCPFMRVIQGMKDIAQDQTKAWVEGRNDLDIDSDYDSDDSEEVAVYKGKMEEGKKIAIAELRRCDMTQFLRVDDPSDPWSLEEMTPKVSLVVDNMEPLKYKTPPRRGSFDPSHQDKTWKDGALPTINKSVWTARQVGCDTILLVVPGFAITQMAKHAGWKDKLDTPACSVASFIAKIDDEKEGESIKWKFHNFFTADMLEDGAEGVMPKFPGSVEILVEPPEDEDPNEVPTSKWAAFPPPDPEYIPANYPDLACFSMALEVPEPNEGLGMSSHHSRGLGSSSHHSAMAR